ncbi:hypothetical protein [uncultured Tessaracoccus sp.]|uniref:hypothetical protein n=1 Tax=uncultured Tessaracoccus sp. TaxID=905023 RepID=UPI0025E20A70|nr:hypothetical protein [uncultured Tessaracoccus sp.]
MTTPDQTRPGVELLAGDMQMWSDFDPGRQGDDLRVLPAPTPVWERLLAAELRRATGRVLLVGAEAAKCVGLLPADAHVDIVVRSRTDAGVLVAARPGTRVHAGSVLCFEPSERYDLVLALDTVDDILTPDDEVRTTGVLLDALEALVRERGRLVVRIANRVGLDALVAERPRPNLHWGEPDPGLPHRGVLARLPGARLLSVVGRTPHVVLDAEHAANPEHAGLLSALVANVVSADVDPLLVGRDPMTVVPSVVESGELERFAPSWLAVTGELATPGLVADLGLSHSAPGREIGIDLEVDEDPEDDGRKKDTCPQPTEAERAWRRLLVDDEGLRIDAPGGETLLGPLVRRVEERLSLPAASQLLEARWREAAASGEPERLRDEVRHWARWLESIDPAMVWFASPHNVLAAEDGSLQVLDPTWRWMGGEDLDAATILCLRRFALRLLDTGASHPWPASVSLDSVTESLTLMAGGTWDEDVVPRAVRVGERIRALLDDGDETHVEDRVERSLLAGRQHRLSVGGRLSREAQQRLLNQLGNEAAAQQLKVDWYERHVRRRDGQLDGLERQLESIEASIPYKVARAVTWPGRAAIRGVKGLVKRALPPSAWRRLIAAVRKRLR